MTEKQFKESIDYIYRQFETIQLSKVTVKREKGKFTDSLFIAIDKANELVNDIYIHIVYNFCANRKWLYVNVNFVDVCSMMNENMTLKAYYDNVERTLLDILKSIERL